MKSAAEPLEILARKGIRVGRELLAALEVRVLEQLGAHLLPLGGGKVVRGQVKMQQVALDDREVQLLGAALIQAAQKQKLLRHLQAVGILRLRLQKQLVLFDGVGLAFGLFQKGQGALRHGSGLGRGNGRTAMRAEGRARDLKRLSAARTGGKRFTLRHKPIPPHLMIRRTAPESQGRYGFGAYLRRRGALFRKNRKFPLAKPGEVVYNIIVARSGHADIAQ